MTAIKEAIRQLSKNSGFDALIELATIQSVDKSEATCIVTLVDDPELELYNVKLTAVTPSDTVADLGLIIYPELGSYVLIGQVNNDPSDLFVVQTTKIESIVFKPSDDLSLIVTPSAGEIRLKAPKIILNEGENKGVPLVKALTEKINQLEKKVNDLIDDFKGHKHAGVTIGAGISGIGDKQSMVKIAPITQINDLQNNKNITMKDILLDDNLDLSFQSGDFAIGESEEQHQQLIIVASKGSFRESPLTGVNLARFIKTGFTQAQIDQLKQNIKLQLQYDGYTSSIVVINSFSDIQIDSVR